MMAWGTYGAGRFVVETDSSPADDGTGSSGHTLYNDRTAQGVNHPHLFLNASVWLASVSTNGIPYNDNFANAATLAFGATVATGTNVHATKEAGEPNHGNNAGGHSVWWQWTAPGSGSLTVSTVGSSFDTTLGVYTGTAVNALTTLGEDDDSGGNSTSLLTVNGVTAGTTYSIAVNGYGSSTGTVMLKPTLGAPGADLANDNFANAAVLTGTNVGATLGAGETAFYNGSHSVWWQWTAPGDLFATVSTAGSSFDTTLVVETGTAVNALDGGRQQRRLHRHHQPKRSPPR